MNFKEIKIKTIKKSRFIPTYIFNLMTAPRILHKVSIHITLSYDFYGQKKVRKKNLLFKIKVCSLDNLNIIYFFSSFFRKIFIWVLVRIGFEPNEQIKKTD